jgi:galactoside O-acetyltransferase
MSSFYNEEELSKLGLKKYGKNVLISRNACLYGTENMEIGDNTRIDDFCVLSGKITMGNYIHIAPFCLLAGGQKGITMHDFSGLSSKVSLYAASDDYSGSSLTNPTVDEKFKHVISEEIILERHVIIGATSVILPGVTLKEGSAVGSMSLVVKDAEPWMIYAGIPAKPVKERNKDLLKMEKDFLVYIEG